MEAKNKETYKAPAMLVVEVKAKGIVCMSDPSSTPSGNRNGYGNVYELD